MTKTSFFIKQGDCLSLGPWPGKRSYAPFVNPPRLFLSPHPGAVMKVNPLYKDVPYLQEKLKTLKQHIISNRATVALWEASEPDYPLLPKVKEQLERELVDWIQISGGQPCP